MDENTNRLPYALLFAITALSFLFFNLAMKIMEGMYSTLLFRIAFWSGILSVLCWAVSHIAAGKHSSDTR